MNAFLPTKFSQRRFCQDEISLIREEDVGNSIPDDDRFLRARSQSVEKSRLASSAPVNAPLRKKWKRDGHPATVEPQAAGKDLDLVDRAVEATPFPSEDPLDPIIEAVAQNRYRIIVLCAKPQEISEERIHLDRVDEGIEFPRPSGYQGHLFLQHLSGAHLPRHPISLDGAPKGIGEFLQNGVSDVRGRYRLVEVAENGKLHRLKLDAEKLRG